MLRRGRWQEIKIGVFAAGLFAAQGCSYKEDVLPEPQYPGLSKSSFTSKSRARSTPLSNRPSACKRNQR